MSGYKSHSKLSIEATRSNSFLAPLASNASKIDDSPLFKDVDMEGGSEADLDRAYKLRWGASREKMNSQRNSPSVSGRNSPANPSRNSKTKTNGKRTKGAGGSRSASKTKAAKQKVAALWT